jgi:hypothetical protein
MQLSKLLTAKREVIPKFDFFQDLLMLQLCDRLIMAIEYGKEIFANKI